MTVRVAQWPTVSACYSYPVHNLIPFYWASLKPGLGIRALLDHHEFTFPTSVSKDVSVISDSDLVSEHDARREYGCFFLC